MVLSPFSSGAELAVCQCCSRRIAEKDGDDGKVAAAGSSSEREQMRRRFHRRWKQPEGEDRTKMKKEAGLHLANWISLEYRERKYMRRYKGKCDIFFEMEHRLRKEEMEEQFNKEVKEGWRFAAHAARITDERAGSEDQKHTSGGVLWQSTAT